MARRRGRRKTTYDNWTGWTNDRTSTLLFLLGQKDENVVTPFANQIFSRTTSTPVQSSKWISLPDRRERGSGFITSSRGPRLLILWLWIPNMLLFDPDRLSLRVGLIICPPESSWLSGYSILECFACSGERKSGSERGEVILIMQLRLIAFPERKE